MFQKPENNHTQILRFKSTPGKKGDITFLYSSFQRWGWGGVKGLILSASGPELVSTAAAASSSTQINKYK